MHKTILFLVTVIILSSVVFAGAPINAGDVLPASSGTSTVDIGDVLFITSCLGQTTNQCTNADTNGDGQVNIFDFIHVAQYWGKTYTIPPTTSCGDGFCNGAETTGSCPRDCPAPTGNLPIITFSSAPYAIQVGSSTTLQWSASGATSCSAPWTTSTATSGTQSVSPTSGTSKPTGTVYYAITCTGAGGSQTASASVALANNNAPTITFLATPSAINKGSSTTLTWSVTNAATCTASTGWGGSGWGGSKAVTGGSQTGIAPTSVMDYTLTCVASNGNSSKVLVTVSVCGDNICTGLETNTLCPIDCPTRASGAYVPFSSKDWSTYADKAALAGLFGVEGGLNSCGANCVPNLPKEDFYDIMPDPLWGKVIRYNGGPHLDMTTNPVGRIAVHGVSLGGKQSVWVRQYVRFSPTWTVLPGTGYKLMFLRYQVAGRMQYELSDAWHNTDYLTVNYPPTVSSALYNTIPSGYSQIPVSWSGDRCVLPFGVPGGGILYMGNSNGDCPGTVQPSFIAPNYEWGEMIMGYQRTADPRKMYSVWAWRQYTQNGAVNPMEWHIDIASHYNPTGDFGIVGRYEMGVNRNGHFLKNMSIEWGPYEVVDGSKYCNPFGIPLPANVNVC